MPHQCTGCGHTFEDGSKEMLSGCPDCGGNKFQFRPAGESSEIPSDDTPADTSSDDGATPPDTDGSSVAETVGRATTRVRDFVSSGPEAPPADTTRSAESAGSAAPDPAAEWPDDWDNDPGKAHSRGSNRHTADDTDDERDTAKRGDEIDSTAEPSDGDIIDADAHHPSDDPVTNEDLAQANARSDIVSPEELDERAVESPDEGTDSSTASTADGMPGAGITETSTAPSEGNVVSEPTGEQQDLTDLREQLNDQFESIKILEPGQYELNLMELYDREEYIIALQENGRYVIQVPEQWIGNDPDDR
ncbi:MAG: OapC/ArvC family zinc-ribbon domain-containing protein [Halobacteriota archaeon]|uniref:OapC/ArvC family zinc-ribbon domain-containing protein n=1 Tax=Natronomonas sp. TaxID=2184060 RepID=UPI0039748D0A